MRRYAQAFALLALVAAASVGCAPANTGSTYRSEQIGRAATVTTGTIVSMRTVSVQGTSGGVGTLAGATAGGVAGSFIGGDWRSNLLAGVAGAVIGGVAGSAVERGVTSGSAMEFIIEEDNGGTIAVVQTNEDGFRVGDRVTILRGDRTRLTPARG